MRILYAGADRDLGPALELMLGSEGVRCEFCDIGDEAFDLAARYVYDAILVDDQLDDMSGKTVLQGLRIRKLATPVIMLTANRDIAWECRVLDAGADDVLHKPFAKSMLLSRLRAVTRRWNGHASSKLENGALVLDLAEKSAFVQGARVHLTGKEYQMLEVLVLRAGAVLTKQHLMDAMYGGYDEPEIKIVDVFVCKIRTKIRELGGGDLIRTVWGRGYTIDAPRALGEESALGVRPDNAFAARDNKVWDDESCRTLRDHISAGLSASQAANAMGRTRNAVIARAYRSGWKFGRGLVEA